MDRSRRTTEITENLVPYDQCQVMQCNMIAQLSLMFDERLFIFFDSILPSDGGTTSRHAWHYLWLSRRYHSSGGNRMEYFESFR